MCANLSEWFTDNKQSIHFGEDRTKCILLSKERNLPELNITCDNNRMKQFHILAVCYLDGNLSVESMALKSLKKINAKFQFSSRQNEFLNPKLRRLLYNSLIQIHLDDARVPLVKEKIRKKKQVTQNKHCIKSVRIWSYSGQHFPTFGLNTERYRVSSVFSANAGKCEPE